MRRRNRGLPRAPRRRRARASNNRAAFARLEVSCNYSCVLHFALSGQAPSPNAELNMTVSDPILLSQRVVQVCLVLVGLISIFGGSLQMYLGQPETAPRLDNVHRFMAGIYLMSGITGLWVAATIRQHDTLVFLLALTVLAGGTGRLLSISRVGLPEPSWVWLGYLVPELLIPWIIIGAQIITNRQVASVPG